MGVAPMTISPFAAWLISAYDWRTAMLVIGIGAWVLLLPASLLVRTPAAASPADAAGARSTNEGPSHTTWSALATPQFAVLAGTFFLCCAAHSGPIFHMVSYAISCGIPALAAVTIYSVEGLAGLGGRLLLGVAADRLGVKRVLIAGLLVQAFVMGGYLYANSLGTFYALAILFGGAYGGVMPLYAVLAREYFGQRVMGTVMGAAGMASSIGMAIGPLGGGWLFDAFGVYDWLFIASLAIGVAAVAVALAFPPFPSRDREALQAA
jgi:predicted MFS family arabinose efflux permease